MPILTIRFINAIDLVSKLVTGETFSLICHVEAMNRARDKWVGAHAFTGIEARTLDWCKDLTWERRYDIFVTDADYEKAMTFQESAIGTKYNYRGILGIFLRNRKWNSKDRRDCSEHVFELLLASGRQSLNVLPDFDWMVTPEMLHLSPIFIGKTAYRVG